jgi:multicomponent Na+:H+ antiporter subunit B
MRKNLLMLHTVTRIVVFIILAFSVFLFFAGHNNPGGGFIGGLMTAAALLLLYVAFDVKTIKQVIPFNYTTMIGVGLLIAIGTGIYSMVNGDPFLTQYDDYLTVPVLGKIHLTTALPFDLGVYLVVVGVALLSIISIAEDDA